MPPKSGPAKAKSPRPATDEGTAAASPGASEPKETATDSAREQATPAVEESKNGAEPKIALSDETPPTEPVTNPSVSAREAVTKLYPEGTELWYAEVHGLVFAFPRITNITPARQWLRQIYNLTEVAQTFEWMALAKVPPEIQARTDLLTDEQYRALFNAWFVDGEVSLPK